MPGRFKNVGIPRNVGRDEIRISKSDGKVKLFAKYLNKWYATPLSDIFEVKNQHLPVKDGVIAFDGKNKGRLVPNITMNEKDGIAIKNTNRTEGVRLIQDSNVLQVRNLINTDDATIQAKKLKLSLSATDGEQEFRINYDAANYIKFTVTSAGYLTITTVGTSLGTNSLKYNGAFLEFNGSNHRYIQVADNDNDGNDLELRGGSAAAGQTNKSGGAILVRGGKGTGDDIGGHIQFKISKPGTSGTSQNAWSTAGYFSGETGDLRLYNDLLITAADKLYLDSGGDTYIVENGIDNVRIVVGDDILLQLNEAGDNGNTITLGGSAGFKMVEPTYDVVIASATTAFNTDVDFRFGNKARLELTASQAVPVLGFIFPSTSGNFVLALEQASGGSGTVSDYKAYTYDEAAATTTDLLWAGGVEPTLTTTGNKTDIISIFWDVETEIAYATITQNF